jgi:uncharacterized protein with PIN domain
MKNLFILLLVIVFASCKKNEKNNTETTQVKIKSPYSFFPKEKPQVLVVGTFHFNYPGLDAHKVSEENKMDILNEKRQKEVRELVNYIKKFKPTKIAVEIPITSTYNKKNNANFKAYKKGEYTLKRNEGDQLAYRVAKEMNLDTIYGVDAGSLMHDIGDRDSIYAKNLWKDYDWKSDDPIDKIINKVYEYGDKMDKETTLMENFTHMNSRDMHNFMYGTYLTGDFKLDDYRGSDVLASYWYSRNLRIFRNIQKITEDPEDRILVIFGNAHAAILRNLIECSPEYDFVEFDSL